MVPNDRFERENVTQQHNEKPAGGVVSDVTFRSFQKQGTDENVTAYVTALL